MELSKNDRWAVISPGRTGSKVIVDCLRNTYRDNGLRLTYLSPDIQTSNLSPLSIYHTHNHHNISLAEQGVNLILSTRDLVDSAISWCISHKIGYYHLYSSIHQSEIDKLHNNLPSFILSPADLYFQYKMISRFYENLDKSLLSNVIVIDYEDIKDDHTIVYSRLRIPESTKYKKIPTKNPGTPDQWIINWKEIAELASKLERRPLL